MVPNIFVLGFDRHIALSCIDKEIWPININLQIGGGVILAVVCACLMRYLPINLPKMFQEPTVMATAFYLSGFICRDFAWIKKREAILLLGIPAVVSIFTGFSMEVTGIECLVYYPIAIAGTIGIVALSNYLAQSRIAGALAKIGETTLYILIFHFLSFKLVSYFYIVANGLPIEMLSQFPGLKVDSSWIWIAYSVVGVALPMAFWKVSKIKLFRKI